MKLNKRLKSHKQSLQQVQFYQIMELDSASSIEPNSPRSKKPTLSNVENSSLLENQNPKS